MLTGFGQLVRLGKVCGFRTISRGGWASLWRTELFIPSSKLRTAEVLVLQIERSTRATQDFVVQLRMICDSAFYAYLSKVANTAGRRHYLHALCTAVDRKKLGFREFDAFVGNLHKFKVFDLHLSFFPLDDLRVLAFTMNRWSDLSHYFRDFRSRPERSKEFYYDAGLWHTLVATRYMRFLRTLTHFER